MRPGFTALFRRGKFAQRFRRGEDDELAQVQQEQQERFAVSMIALTIKNDASFKQHFMKEVCGVSENEDTKTLEVEIEPADWGELVLKSNASVFVIEFKIGAPLENHQNPAKNEFWREATRGRGKNGYGFEVANKFKKEGKNLTYITLEVVPSWTKPKLRNGQLICKSRNWTNLKRGASLEVSQWEHDLYKCLGDLGVDCFRTSMVKNKKLIQFAKEAVVIHELLTDFRKFLKDEHGLQTKGIDYGGIDTSGYWSCGCYIYKSARSRLGKILRINSSIHGQFMGWFGYENETGPLLTFHFYPSTLAVFDKVEKLLTNHGEITPWETDLALRVSRGETTTDEVGDLEWLKGVLEALTQRSG